MTKSIQPIDWAALGANLGSTQLFTLLLLSPFLWGAAVWHWLLAVAIGLVLGVYFYIRQSFPFAAPRSHPTRSRSSPIWLREQEVASSRLRSGSLPDRADRASLGEDPEAIRKGNVIGRALASSACRST